MSGRGGSKEQALRVAVFSTKPYDRQFLDASKSAHGHDLVFFESRHTRDAARLTANLPALCAFVNDDLNATVLGMLRSQRTRLTALRSAGFNNVDLDAADALDLVVVRVPAYSPYAVAEHTVGLVLALNRKLPRPHNHVREGNFALEGLLGFDLHGRTAAVVGTSKIGTVVARILAGFGCRQLAYDPYPSDECRASGTDYVALPELLAVNDLVTLHVPLTPESYHLIDERVVARMKRGMMPIITGRGRCWIRAR